MGRAQRDAQRFRETSTRQAQRDATSWARIDSLARQRAHEALQVSEQQPHVQQQRQKEQHTLDRTMAVSQYAVKGRHQAKKWSQKHKHLQQRTNQLASAAQRTGPEIKGKDVRVATSGARLQDFTRSRLHVRTVSHNSQPLQPTTNRSRSQNHSPNKMAAAARNQGVRDAVDAARKVRERNRLQNERAAERRLRAAEKALQRGAEALRKIKARDSLPETLKMLSKLDKVDRLERAQRQYEIEEAARDRVRRPDVAKPRAEHDYPTYVNVEMNPRGRIPPKAWQDDSDPTIDSTPHYVPETGAVVNVVSADDEAEDERLFEQAFMQDSQRQLEYEKMLLADDDRDNADEPTRSTTLHPASDSLSNHHESLAEPMQHWFGTQKGDAMLLQREPQPPARQEAVNIPTRVEPRNSKNDMDIVEEVAEQHLASGHTSTVSATPDLDDLDRQLSENASWWKNFATVTKELADGS